MVLADGIPPERAGRATVHHLGVVTDEIEVLVERLRALGVSVRDIRREPAAVYTMAEGPDGLLGRGGRNARLIATGRSCRTAR